MRVLSPPHETIFPLSGLTPVDPEPYAPSGRNRGVSAVMGASAGPARELFQTRDVVQMLGISRRQLQYWSKTDLVTPSVVTPGGHSRYTFEDLVALKAAKRLIDSGVSVQKLRNSLGALRRILPTVHRPLAELVLVATGDVVLAFRDGAAFDAVSGQEWVFEVAQLQRDVDAWRRSSDSPAAPRAPRLARRELRRDRSA